jgi:hypothetical protein
VPAAGRQLSHNIVVQCGRQRQLPQMSGALLAPSQLASGVDRWKHQLQEQRQQGQHDQNFQER